MPDQQPTLSQTEFAVSDELLETLIHDAQVEADAFAYLELDKTNPERDCTLPLRDYTDGVLTALRELKERRSA